MFHMRRTALAIGLLLALAACAPSGGVDLSADLTAAGTAESTVTAETTLSFPVTVQDSGGAVTIESRPERIVSLSSTATEMLFAIGAGDQVVAVDEYSTYPAEAPVTDLSGFSPNMEAIIGFEPDLVFLSYDPGDLQAGLAAVGIPSLRYTTALSLDDSYDQIEAIGAVTGHIGEAAEVVSAMQSDIDRIVAFATVPEEISFYHEEDETL